MKAGGDHAAADPIASGMITGLRRAEISDLITRKAETEEGEEVELSLGLSVGGSKRKAGDFLRNRIPTRNRNPNPDPIVGVPMYVPVVNGSGFPCLVPCQPLANPNPNPNGREIGGKRRVRMKREPSLSGSVVSSSSGSLRGSIGNSGETQSNSNPITADLKPKDQAIQEVISKPTILAAAAPPLPVNQTAALDGAKADQMPCVMTKGPNGETISGFLYRYSKSEVSIVCVCHGTSFSPAGFVRHAGGKVSPHPLRQIVVVPSCALELTL